MINFNKINNKKNSITLNISIFLLILLLVSTIIFTGKTILDILNLNQQIYQKRLELETKYQQGMSLKKTNLEVEQSKQRLEKINQIIINTEDTLSFINDIEKTAEANNIAHTIKLPDFEKPKTPTPISIQITLNGSYVNTLRFIENLQNKPYYINIHNLSFNQQSATLITSIEANMYWQ
jgi:Tfp pilus assembly protein PilO